MAQLAVKQAVNEQLLKSRTSLRFSCFLSHFSWRFGSNWQLFTLNVLPPLLSCRAPFHPVDLLNPCVHHWSPLPPFLCRHEYVFFHPFCFVDLYSLSLSFLFFSNKSIILEMGSSAIPCQEEMGSSAS